MLELSHISKIYRTGGQTKKALDDISINFRSNEFVSILGQSGSGKTTMLNIIGGLDQYTEGDLVINGKSTKDFKDRDWDAYRNHTIGFVFQSYNLISHQTALSNVELAMTISGVSKRQRRKRAIEALKRVGLEEHIHKRPNQMSGGQMQRIAIARALVNDPEILLADEPTGALDSETSVQIMELLKEIAKERLVIMVTHNPELAERYSTRIVKVLDGHIIDDNHPYDPQSDDASRANFKKTKMGFRTALGLSFNNLLTKKGRTLLTAFAGSIGIIGIALILALSNGVSDYVSKVQEDTLVGYPLTISKSGNNGLAISLGTDLDTKDHTNANKVGVDASLSQLLSTEMVENDLKSFKSYLDQHKDKFDQLTKDIQYSYQVAPMVYATDTDNGIRAVNPANLSDYIQTDKSAIKAYASDLSYWDELSDNQEMLDSQYDVVEGHYPKGMSELLLILDDQNNISDGLLYSLGIKNPEDLSDSKKTDRLKETTFDYQDLIGKSFKLVVNSAVFQKENGLWVTKVEDQAYMKQLIDQSQELKIVGIARPKKGTSAVTQSGIGYSKALTDYLSQAITSSEIAKEQTADPKTNVFTGQPFTTEIKEFSSDQLSDEQKLAMAQMSPEELAAYVKQYNENITATYEDNLEKIGVTDLSNPSAINFYTESFEQKQDLKAAIDDYNKTMKKAGDDQKVLNYTDSIALIMSSITTMISVITGVLVGFVAISLVVSSIMIAIITYISVLERTKEIGILRAMGASKKDVRRIFTAETAIEGLISGLLGIGITVLLTIPINSIVKSQFGVDKVATLPVVAGIVLVLISIFLSMLAGVIPSRMAAKKDPVEALRTE